MNKILVIVIEDHDLTGIGLVTPLQGLDDIEIVREAANGLQGLRVLENA